MNWILLFDSGGFRVASSKNFISQQSFGPFPTIEQALAEVYNRTGASVAIALITGEGPPADWIPDAPTDSAP